MSCLKVKEKMFQHKQTLMISAHFAHLAIKQYTSETLFCTKLHTSEECGLMLLCQIINDLKFNLTYNLTLIITVI